jgi:hypothetical protein
MNLNAASNTVLRTGLFFMLGPMVWGNNQSLPEIIKSMADTNKHHRSGFAFFGEKPTLSDPDQVWLNRRIQVHAAHTPTMGHGIDHGIKGRSAIGRQIERNGRIKKTCEIDIRGNFNCAFAVTGAACSRQVALFGALVFLIPRIALPRLAFVFAIDIGIKQNTVIIGVIGVMLGGCFDLTVTISCRHTARTSRRKPTILANL